MLGKHPPRHSTPGCSVQLPLSVDGGGVLDWDLGGCPRSSDVPSGDDVQLPSCKGARLSTASPFYKSVNRENSFSI